MKNALEKEKMCDEWVLFSSFREVERQMGAAETKVNKKNTQRGQKYTNSELSVTNRNIHEHTQQCREIREVVVVSLPVSPSHVHKHYSFQINHGQIADHATSEGRGQWVTIRQEWQTGRGQSISPNDFRWLHHALSLSPSTSSHAPSLIAPSPVCFL